MAINIHAQPAVAHAETTASGIRYTTDTGYVLHVVTSDWTVVATENEIEVDSTAAARTITLPDRRGLAIGHKLIVKDGGGAAGVSRITITAGGSDTIDGASTYVIRSNYGAATLRLTDDGWSVMDVIDSGGGVVYETTLTAAAQNIPIPASGSLAGNTDEGYEIEVYGQVAGGNVGLDVNGGGTACTYSGDVLTDGTLPRTGSGAVIAATFTGVILLTIRFRTKVIGAGNKRNGHFQVASSNNGAANEDIWNGQVTWPNTTDEITSFTITGSVADMYKVGTVVRVKRFK